MLSLEPCREIYVALFVCEVICLAIGQYQQWLKPENLIRLKGWAIDGLTDEDIAHNMGIAVGTLYRWKNEHSEICEALKTSKEVADRIIENALFERAKGIHKTIKKPIKVKQVLYSPEGRKIAEKEVIEQAEEEIYVPPDTTAAIFWLKNRKPEQWRDKRQVEEHIEFESDGFMEAIMADAIETFQKAEGDGIVET